MKKENITKIISLFFNLFVSVSGIVILLYILIYGYGTPLIYGSLHYEYLEYFTVLSNVYAAVIAGIVFVYLILNFKKNDFILPKWLSLLHLSSATSLALTALTVICFLGPTQGFTIMYKEDMFFYHLFNPILTVTSFILVKHPKYRYLYALFGVVPMLVYGAFYSSFVLSNVWKDFYGFTFGGNWWAIFIALPIMICVTYLISFVLVFVTTRRQK